MRAHARLERHQRLEALANGIRQRGLAHLRERGCHAPALFIHDFPARRLDNLRQLYGDVHAIPSFDASAIATVLGA